MKNIHLIPTIPNDETVGGIWIPKTRDWCNVYITSDEEIREGDWCYHPLLKGGCIIRSKFDNPNSTMKKIVLTTDEDLIKDGVQAIDDEFLEWFVKNPSCEEIEVRKVEQIPNGITFGMFGNDEPPTELVYKIIIPKEEPKQDLEKEMFDLEQELDIPSNLRWHNSKPKQRLEKYSERFDNKDNELVEGIFNPDTWGKRMVDDAPKEITLEEVFNDEKREGVKKIIDQHKVLKGLSLINPLHLQMTSNGHGEFPDGYKLTEKGIQYIIEKLNKE